MLEELVFVDGFRGAGRDVDDADVFGQISDFVAFGIGATGVDIDGETKLTEMVGEFTNVNVHSPGVFVPENGQGRSMD